MNHNSTREIQEYLQAHDLAPKKRWGQNFLVDESSRRRIVALAELVPQSKIWEIGPGLGSLTEYILETVPDPVLFELDYGLIRSLQERFHGIVVSPGDAIETLPVAAAEIGAPDVILGNLPYRSASAIIARIVEAGIVVPRMVFLVQKELAARLSAPPNTADYSALSVLVQSHATVTRAFDVSRNAFVPVPQVASTVILMAPRQDAPDAATSRTASAIARLLFHQRRKTCGAVLKRARRSAEKDRTGATRGASRSGGNTAGEGASLDAGLSGVSRTEDPYWIGRVEDAANRLGIDLSRRAETITVEEYLAWARSVKTS